MGLSETPNSLQTQVTLTNAMPIFGLIVVNGKLAIGIDESVAALKNVDLPTFALPNKPIINFRRLVDNGIYIYFSILDQNDEIINKCINIKIFIALVIKQF